MWWGNSTHFMLAANSKHIQWSRTKHSFCLLFQHKRLSQPLLVAGCLCSPAMPRGLGLSEVPGPQRWCKVLSWEVALPVALQSPTSMTLGTNLKEPPQGKVQRPHSGLPCQPLAKTKGCPLHHPENWLRQNTRRLNTNKKGSWGHLKTLSNTA